MATTFDVKTFTYHPETEKIAALIAARANTDDLHFIRTVTAFYLGIVASSQRVSIALAGDRPVPLNMYTIALAHSGAGKGVITGELESLLEPLTSAFTEDWLALREEKIEKKAERRVHATGEDYDEVVADIKAEVYKLGIPVLWFEEGTSPAVKQMRSSLIRTPKGSINFIVDEIFSTNTSDVMNDLVKSYDVGALKQKLIKHTNDTPRSIDDVAAKVPAQMLLFGTGDLLTNPNIHTSFLSDLNSGLARRCMFAYTPDIAPPKLTANQRYDNLITTGKGGLLSKFKAKIAGMLDPKWFNTTLTMGKATHLYHINYQMWCEDRANTFSDNILVAEMRHRYMKMIKYAGILAMLDDTVVVEIKHIQQSIKLTEAGGNSIINIVKATPLHVRLAEYLAKVGRVTMSQLVIDLSWFAQQTKQQKGELVQLAVEYGYTHNIIITEEAVRGIAYIQGTLITKTNLEQICLSVSSNEAYNYTNGYVEWDQLDKVICDDSKFWVTHHLEGGHRSEDSAIEGFNTIVLDVPYSTTTASYIPIVMAQHLLAEYTYMIYEDTTSTSEHNSYKIVLPLSHNLTFDKELFSAFMSNLHEWLPFDAPPVSKEQRTRKWEGSNKLHSYHDGKLLPALEFIPDTEKQVQHSITARSLQSLTAVDRWFVGHINSNVAGNRENGLLRYTTLLFDAQLSKADIEMNVFKLNKALSSPLPETAIINSVLPVIERCKLALR